MNDTVKTATLVGDPIEAPAGTAPPKTRDQRIADWKNETEAAYQEARRECCNCSPTRAQMLLVEQHEGRSNPPID